MERIPMETRRAMVRHHARAYQRATKGEKGRILEMFVQATGYNRVYAARLLRLQGRRVWLGPGVAVLADVRVRPRRERRRRYGPEVLPPLERIWKLLDYPCGKRLAAAMGEVVRALERHGELHLRGKVREKLLQISASSIDRLLATEKRARQNPKLNYHTAEIDRIVHKKNPPQMKSPFVSGPRFEGCKTRAGGRVLIGQEQLGPMLLEQVLF